MPGESDVDKVSRDNKGGLAMKFSSMELWFTAIAAFGLGFVFGFGLCAYVAASTPQ